MLENQNIAELLAREAEKVEFPAKRALRRAARRAFLWEEEASSLARARRSLTELSGIGPYIERLILSWLDKPPAEIEIPPIRSGFLTIATARRVLSGKPTWLANVKGDLQMHKTWSDGEGTIEEMAAAAKS